nr:hypothetical protein [Tanacetum cinerariifolium]
MTLESVQAMIDHALLRNSTNGDGSHSSHEDNRRNVQTSRHCFYADFMKCPDAYLMTWEVLKKKMTDKYCPQREIKKIEIELWNLKFVADEIEKIDKYVSGLPDNIYGSVKASKRKTLDETIELAKDLMDQKLRTYAERQVYNMGIGERKSYSGNFPKCTKCHFDHNGPCTQKCHKCNKVGHFARDCKSSGNANVKNAPRNNGENPKGNGCFECGATGHFKRDCPKLKNKDEEKVNTPGWVYAVGNAVKRGNTSRDLDLNVFTGTFLSSILFNTGADRSFILTTFSSLIDIVPTPLGNSYDVELVDGKIVRVDTIMWGCTLNFLGHSFNIDLMLVELGSFDVIIGMYWLRRCHTMIVCDEKLVRIASRNETLTFCGKETQISAKKEEDMSERKQIEDVPVVRDYPEVFPKDLPGLPPARPVEFQIDLILRAAPVARAPYRLAPSERKELSEQLQELSKKGFIRPSSSPWGAPSLFENILETTLSLAKSARTRRSKNSIQNSVWTLRVSSHAVRTDKCTCGKANVVADALSRKSYMVAGIKVEEEIIRDLERLGIELYVSGQQGYWASLRIEPDLISRIKEAQKEDSEIWTIVENLDKQVEFRIDDDNVLWQDTRLVVPNDVTLREALLSEAHSSSFSVHLGSTKMYHDLKQYFWWSGMKRD